MSIIYRQQELNSKPPHDGGGNSAFFEPGAEASKCFAHELEDETHVGAIGTLVLEIVYHMADIGVANLAPVSLS